MQDCARACNGMHCANMQDYAHVCNGMHCANMQDCARVCNGMHCANMQTCTRVCNGMHSPLTRNVARITLTAQTWHQLYMLWQVVARAAKMDESCTDESGLIACLAAPGKLNKQTLFSVTRLDLLGTAANNSKFKRSRAQTNTRT